MAADLFAQVPIVAVALVICFRLLPETERRRDITFDWRGALLLSSGALALILALNLGPRRGWADTVVLGAFVVVPLLWGLFVLWERRCRFPLLPLGGFRRRNVTFPIAAQMATNMAYTGSFVLTPLLLGEVLGYSESHTGWLNVSRPLAFAIAGPIAGSWSVRAGERSLGMFGASCVLVSMFGLSVVRPGTSDLWVVGSLALSGIGLGSLSPSMTSSLVNTIDSRDLGVWGAAQQMLNQIGSVTGIQVLKTVQESTAGDGLAASYGHAYQVGAVAAVLGVLSRQLRAQQPAALRRYGAARPAVSQR